MTTSLPTDLAAGPLVCVYRADLEARARLAARLPNDADVVRVDSDDPATALTEAARRHPGRAVLLLAGDAELPPHAWPRLLLAAQAHPDADLWTPLASDLGALDPRASGDAETTDRAVWACSHRALPETLLWSPSCSLWRAGALADTARLPAGGDCHVPVGRRARLCDLLYVESGRRVDERSAPAPAVAALRSRLANASGIPAGYPGLDDRPVLLHVLHGWGGGARRFVADYRAADPHHHHLVLMAQADPQQRLAATGLALHTDPSLPPLREWPLAAPIAATALSSREYRDLLGTVLRDFGVAGVLVSSLIGHALDALRTGLPTAVVCHDYYPLWPRLHADFGDPTGDFRASAIADALAAAADRVEFAEPRAAYWRALRSGYVAALATADACLIVPTVGVHDNLVRIEPQLAARRWQQIPHGLASWPPPTPSVGTDPTRKALRVLVPGRINGGKGEDLLAALVPRLPPGVELVLLGCGESGLRFSGKAGVHLQLDYDRDRLPALLARLRPDLALLPATVAETYSYTLSEMRSLGVPVLATGLGSFRERIRDGVDGLLVEPDATAVATRLAALRSDRSILTTLRRPDPGESCADMAARYRRALALSPRASASAAAPDATARQQLEVERAALRERLGALQADVTRQQAELERRAEWAQTQHRLADERLAWARALQAETAHLKELLLAIPKLEKELQERTEWAQSLQVELQDRDVRLDEQRRYVDSLTAQRDHFETERNRILASLSWRLTRPLRFARRLADGALARLRFRIRRALALMHRGNGSLRTRGVRGTLRRLGQELRPPQPSSALAVPAVSADVETIADIVLPTPELPRASVIVPVFNHLEHTLTCLRALAAQPQTSAFEVIVVDDASTDASAEVLPAVAGLQYQRNRFNLGFIGACNAGAAVARGTYLVFLNNDTAVQPGWLDALLDTFDAHPGTGLVGAKLVYPDGRLQEAGGIVFNDASGWNYGRFEDPADPRFNFVREADYASGAAIALPRALFEQLGGFDTHYAPAYYEDTDLAMRVRQAGRRVLYQPKSVVVHFEGVTSGTDTGSGIKAYQVANRDKFHARWRELLATHPSPPPATPIEIACQHRARKRVLVIDATTPQPDHDSGSLRLVNLMKLLLADGCAVTFFADNRAWLEGYTEALQQLGVEVLWHPWLTDPVAWFAEHGSRLDAVLVSRHYVASSYVELVRRHAPQAKLLFDTVDLHYLREQRAAELAGRDELARSAAATRQRELAVIRQCDVTLVVSPVEQALLAKDAPGARVEVLSNVHEVFGSRRPFAERRDLMFVGGFQHPPNIDAMNWFVGEVWPWVRAAHPELRLHIIGSRATAEVQALGDVEGVSFHGFVADIEPFLDGCRIALAPLRYGAGVKGKVNLSMSYGQPVVATPLAAEGMHLEDGRDVLVADGAEAFAAAVLRLYDDEALWQRLSDHGIANVRTHFGFDAARAVLHRLLE